MKKYVPTLFVILAVMAMLTTTVFAAPAASKSVSVLSVNYNQAGVVIILETSGLTKADLKGATVKANSNWSKDIYCQFIDNTTKVRCTLPGSYAGKGGFLISIGGTNAWGKLPQPRLVSCPVGQSAWYTYNEYHNGNFIYSGKTLVSVWNEALADGFFDVLAQQGYTFEITGTICTADVTNPV